eukprot:jgi/Galph1/740/GphlegSOOS_G5576.1
MEFDEQVIKKICQLAQVQVSLQELTKFAADFNNIVELIQKMNRLDLNGPEAAEYIINSKDTLRRDELNPFGDK